MIIKKDIRRELDVRSKELYGTIAVAANNGINRFFGHEANTILYVHWDYTRLNNLHRNP
ncbi:hypothetical protein [Paenibacillus sp. USDA918EY]|uniref:hypothetical protein n=1 Tax=Paenibacillus sp. USDA918EY TaxID=2689575 RepID=UPI001F157A9E|nr:hypothetical protein [Paenibacillus sp. USDA918EY]